MYFISRDDFELRLSMCERVKEGCELEDIIKTLCSAARMLSAFEDFKCQQALIMAEQLCVEYIKDHLWAKQCDWEEYEECNPEVYTYFTGGARKLTKEEFYGDATHH